MKLNADTLHKEYVFGIQGIHSKPRIVYENRKRRSALTHNPHCILFFVEYRIYMKLWCIVRFVKKSEPRRFATYHTYTLD